VIGLQYRNATLKEREEYYKNEFDVSKLNEMEFKPQLFALDLGSKTGISKFPEKKSQLVILPPGLSPEELKKRMVHYLPESAYYDRNIYTDVNKFFAGKKFKKFWEDENYAGQQLCFDVDAENIKEVDHNHKDNYTDVIREAAQQALQVADLLRKEHSFQKITFTYSGRGFHVKVHDKSAEKLSFRERSKINDTLKGLPIDRWVSGGYSKLMRLPFSLHGVVSRVVTELKESELESFDPSTDERTIPKFMK
jgi:DNA primase small subunit